jgi:hypothetical protein
LARTLNENPCLKSELDRAPAAFDANCASEACQLSITAAVVLTLLSLSSSGSISHLGIVPVHRAVCGGIVNILARFTPHTHLDAKVSAIARANLAEKGQLEREMPRLYHKKSRMGCSRCRARRVKVSMGSFAPCVVHPFRESDGFPAE